MPPTTNPFDDGEDTRRRNNKNHSNDVGSYGHGHPYTSKDDDEHQHEHNYNYNYNYSDDYYQSSDDEYVSNDDDYDDDGNGNGNTSGNGNGNTNGNTSGNGKGKHKNKQKQEPVEASWQFLGDLPYRKVTLYNEIQWGVKPSIDNETIRKEEKEKSFNMLPNAGTGGNDDNGNGNGNEDQQQQQYGLACLPPRNHHRNNMLNKNEYEQYIHSTTNTIITSCLNGGPIATVTVPLMNTNTGAGVGSASGNNTGNNTGSRNASTSTFNTASIRIMTNSGQLLSTIHFPPLFSSEASTKNLKDNNNSNSNSSSNSNSNSNKKSKRRTNWLSKMRKNTKNSNIIYTPNDIFTIGFTGRCILVIVLRDSLCLTYTLSGKPVLDPFYIFNYAGNTNMNMNMNMSINSGGGGGRSVGSQSQSQKKATMMEVIDATIYDGGVAVLCSNMTTAVVEILDSDEESDAFYRDGSHVASRIIKCVDFDHDGSRSSGTGAVAGVGTNTSTSTNTNMNASTGANANVGKSEADGSGPMDDDHNTTSMYALITPLSTSTHAKANYITYTSIAVLPRIHTQSRHPEVFLGTSNNSVIVCDSSCNGSIIDVYCQERISSPIIKMKFAPNGRFLACFTKQCIMTVISTNFETKVLDFDTSDGSNDLPNNMEWCGEDSVVLHWKNLGVLMVGPYGDWLRFPYEHVEYLHLSAEMDCCRVVTDSTVEILQRVPPATAAMLRIGSIEPAAMLLDASDAFENGSPASDEAARAITKTGMLLDAIAVCSDAACREFDIAMQKRLLKAASYGMHFEYKDGSNQRSIMGGRVTKLPNGQEIVHPSPVAVGFVQGAKKIRVLNALRDASVGVAITMAQYDSIEPNGVIARLIAMKRPALATSLSNYLQLDESVKVYARASRASAFVTVDSGHTDAETAEAAIKILNSDVRSPMMNRGAYATVALAAFKAGRRGVASLLLHLEASVIDKVPALTTIGSHSDAAAVAADAKNDDLIFHVLMEFEKYCGLNIADAVKAQSTYLGTVVTKFPPEAVNILVEYFSSMNDVKHVLNLQIKAHNYAKAGSIIAQRALNLPREHERLNMLQEASRVFGIGRDATFQKTCTDEYIELLLEQERLRRAYGPDVTTKTSSVTETIFNVLCYAAVKMRESRKLLTEGEKIAKKFKVPDKRLWHTKIRAFAATDQWTNLRSLAESKTKPPIGFKYFALAVIKKEQSVVEILRYIEKVADGEERYDLFCEAKFWKRAVEEAKKMDDVNRIMHVRTVCNIPEIQRLCETYASMG